MNLVNPNLIKDTACQESLSYNFGWTVNWEIHLLLALSLQKSKIKTMFNSNIKWSSCKEILHIQTRNDLIY